MSQILFDEYELANSLTLSDSQNCQAAHHDSTLDSAFMTARAADGRLLMFPRQTGGHGREGPSAASRPSSESRLSTAIHQILERVENKVLSGFVSSSLVLTTRALVSCRLLRRSISGGSASIMRHDTSQQ